MRDISIRLPAEDYTHLKYQMHNVRAIEMTQGAGKDTYRKTIRLKIGNDLTLEFQGPLVNPPLEA